MEEQISGNTLNCGMQGKDTYSLRKVQIINVLLDVMERGKHYHQTELIDLFARTNATNAPSILFKQALEIAAIVQTSDGLYSIASNIEHPQLTGFSRILAGRRLE